MTEINLKLLKLIQENKTLNEISQELGLSNKQIHARLVALRNNGYNFKRKFYYNGDVIYKMIKQINYEEQKEKTIITSSKDDSFKALLISDIHLGSEYERLDCIYKLYDYCIKEGINIILNAGDFIDGTFGGPKKTDDIEEQIKIALKKYPFDKSILNFVCLGNHDASSKTEYALDLNDVLENKRPDIISLGYGNGIINVKNDQIILKHPIQGVDISDDFKHKLILKGHTHYSKMSEGLNNVIYLPSLSDIAMKDNIAFPSAFKMELGFNKGYFSTGLFKQLLVGEKVLTVNEIFYELYRGKNIPISDNISNEEDIKEKVLEKKINSTNPQVAKFYKKYGK